MRKGDKIEPTFYNVIKLTKILDASFNKLIEVIKINN